MNAPAELPAQAEVTEKRGVQSTEYRIVGSLAAVFAAIERIFNQNHPFGYGTMVHTIQMTNTEDVYAARMSRSNSCD